MIFPNLETIQKDVLEAICILKNKNLSGFVRTCTN